MVLAVCRHLEFIWLYHQKPDDIYFLDFVANYDFVFCLVDVCLLTTNFTNMCECVAKRDKVARRTLNPPEIFPFRLILMKFLHFSTENNLTIDTVDASNVKRRRLNIESSQVDDSTSRMYLSQPVPRIEQDEEHNHYKRTENESDTSVSSVAPVSHFSFSQPTLMDDLILSTQLNPTQGTQTQNIFQRWVKRMTRFFVTIKLDDTMKRLTVVVEKLGYNWKIHDEVVSLRWDSSLGIFLIESLFSFR